MADKEIKITIMELENMLREQKSLVIKRLISNSHMFNLETKPGHDLSLPIDKDKFEEYGMKSEYPQDFIILKRYVR